MHSLGRLLNYVSTKRGEIAVSAAYLCMIISFIIAYFHPSKSVLVAVNGFNEANIELILILVSLPAAARFIFSIISQDEHD